MDTKKVIQYLGDLTADPFSSEISMAIIDRIENNKPMGRLIVRLIEHAEAGRFK